MALKKSDLYSSLWKSCDELRGGMDASQYKDYILTLLFVKYVTDKAKSDPNSLIDVPSGGSFDDILALKGDKEIGEKINKVIGRLAEANDLQKVIDLADFDDEEKLGKAKEMVDRLTKLVSIFNDLDFRGSRAEGDDLLGDAYEYLMRHFATESGKSKGQFYTPAEVSRILAKVVGIGPKTRQDQTVYDPACGSGSLLLKVAAEAPRGITIYGQEKDNATWALSKMNMILHGNEDADIQKGDTITNPQFTKGNQLRTFDFAVMNPPFSSKSWSNGLENEYGRFELGRPPTKNGDYAFLLHVLKSLKSNGKAAIILPHGALLRPNAEAAIRRQLVERGYIKGIIGLPANLFYGTGIPACIVLLDKENAASRTSVFMIDASKGYIQDGNKNRLRSQDIHKIVDVFEEQITVSGYSRQVPLDEIASDANRFNLNVSRYIESPEQEDAQDLLGHLYGGIPERDIDSLARYWDAFPNLQTQLFSRNRPGYFDFAIEVSKVQQTILDAEEFQKFAVEVRGKIDQWFASHRAALQSINVDTKPSELITTVADDLLATFKNSALLDEYDVYERLMTYWHEIVHDDVFLVMNEGWLDAAKPRATIEDKERKLSEIPDLVVGSGRTQKKYKTDLIPPAVIVSRYLAAEQAQVADLETASTEASRVLDEYIEEHSAEEGVLAGAMDDGKITKTLASSRLREARAEGADAEEITALQQLIKLYETEAKAKKETKDAQAALDVATLAMYGQLTETEIKALVLDDKWLGAVTSRVAGELEALNLALVGRAKELGERYELTLEQIDTKLTSASSRMGEHLKILTGSKRLPGFTGEWREVTLGSLLSYEQPTKYLVTTTKQLDVGRIPVLTAGKTFVLGYTNDAHGVCTNHPVIIFDDFTTASKYVDFDFKAKSSAMKILAARPGVADLRFIYERMQLLNFRVGDHKRHWISEFSRLTLLVPELKEQQAIAKLIADFDVDNEMQAMRQRKIENLKRSAMQGLCLTPSGAPQGISG